jgi:hypothetical protein
MVVFILFHIAKSLHSKIGVFDVKAAFLEGENDFEQYCHLPPEICPGNVSIRLRILKSLYGQKQAPKIWNDKVNSILIEMGFERCPVCPCLYVWRDEDMYLYTSVHVDDGLMVADSNETIDSFMETFNKHITKATLFRPVLKYLGMEVEDRDDYIHLHLQKYISEIDLLGIKDQFQTSYLPMNANLNLRILPQNEKLGNLLEVTGTLRYVVDRTRPDVLVAVGEIASNGSPHPTDQHVETAKKTIRYLKSTADRKLRLGGVGEIKLFAYSDASHITTGNCKGRLGGCMFLGRNSGAFHSFSKNDKSVSHSSTEVEIKAIDINIRNVLYVRDILKFLGLEQNEPTIIYTDNASALELCKTLKSTENTRHIGMRINFLRQSINRREIDIKFIGTDSNIADILTKPLGNPKFNEFSFKLMNGVDV